MIITKNRQMILNQYFRKFISKLIKTLLTLGALAFVPQTAMALQNTILVEWQFPTNPHVVGFRLYHENDVVCSTDNIYDNTMYCKIDLPSGKALFTLTALYIDGTESAQSSPYPLDIPRNTILPFLYYLILKPSD